MAMSAPVRLRSSDFQVRSACEMRWPAYSWAAGVVPSASANSSQRSAPVPFPSAMPMVAPRSCGSWATIANWPTCNASFRAASRGAVPWSAKMPARPGRPPAWARQFLAPDYTTARKGTQGAWRPAPRQDPGAHPKACHEPARPGREAGKAAATPPARVLPEARSCGRRRQDRPPGGGRPRASR